jgi:hypothetical protein
MYDLRHELTGLCHAYEQLAAQGRGVVLQFMGVQSGVGVSTCARAFSRMLAPRMSRNVWLLDLDFYANTQYQVFSSDRAQKLYGAIGPARASVMHDAPLFWRIHPELLRDDGRKAGDRFYLKMHQVGTHQLYVSHFRSDLLRDKQQVHLRPARTYWSNVRDTVGLTVIDSPTLSRGRGGLVTAADADGVVIIAHPSQAGAPVVRLRQQIEGRGGRCIGVIYNGAPLQGYAPTQQAAQ